VQCKEHDKWIFPSISTVTYLDATRATRNPTPVPVVDTPGGAPLIIFNTTFEDDSDFPSKKRKRRKLRALPIVKPSKSWSTFPIPGRHVSFDGRFLHGVVSEILPLCTDDASLLESKYSRLSLLVNIWHHRPLHLLRCPSSTHSQDLPPAYFSFFPAISSTLEKQKQHLVAVQQNKVVSSILGCIQKQKQQKKDCITINKSMYTLQEHVDGDTALLPLALFQHEFNQMIQFSRSPKLNESKVIYIKYL